MTNNPTGDAQVRIQDWLKTARQKLAAALARSPAGQLFTTAEQLSNDETAFHEVGFEAQLLLGKVLDKSRAWMIAHPETLLDSTQQAALDDLLAQRISGVPLPYLLGHWEFFGLDFEVNPHVLIPRPETELLVERALEQLHNRPVRGAADAGTGSGCIAISLLKNVPALRMIATDVSWQALQVARRNAAHHGVLERLALTQADLFSAVGGPFELVCANLPYIPQTALQDLDVARHEPTAALDGGADGLDAIRRLVADAPRWLAAGGRLLLEMQFDQGDAILRMARQCLPDARAEVLLDLAGKPRLVEINQP